MIIWLWSAFFSDNCWHVVRHLITCCMTPYHMWYETLSHVIRLLITCHTKDHIIWHQIMSYDKLTHVIWHLIKSYDKLTPVIWHLIMSYDYWSHVIITCHTTCDNMLYSLSCYQTIDLDITTQWRCGIVLKLSPRLSSIQSCYHLYNGYYFYIQITI